MKSTDHQPVADAARRRRAEAKARTQASPDAAAQSPATAAQLFHELRVHQIELQMQNDELRTTQAELDAARARYFHLYDLAPVGYVTLSAKELILEANLAAAALLGVARNGLVKQRLSRFIVKDNQDAYYRLRRCLAESGAPQAIELRMTRHNGTEFLAHVVATAVQATDGTSVCYIALSDNPERQRVDDELRQRSHQLAQLASDLTVSEHRERRRLADLLHDHLQQLLFGAQIQFSALAAESGSWNGAAVENLRCTLDTALESSRSITKDLAPPLSLHKDVPAAITWLAQEEERRGSGLQVSVQIDAIQPTIPEAAAVLLFTAARELLRNIVKHAVTRKASLRLTQQSGPLVLVVSDLGKGADPEALRTPNGRGGFGLFSIRERAELLGGSLRVDTAPGRGMCVTLSLPVPAPAPAPAPAPVDAADTPAPGSRCRNATETPPASAPARGQGLRVVFADDHRVVREALINLLRSQSAFTVVGEAGNGEEAVACVERLHPDVVVMDVSMPVMDGVEATRIICERWPEVRVVGLSMFDDDTVAERMREAGAMAYATKSAPLENLIAAICAGGRESRRPEAGAEDGQAWGLPTCSERCSR